MVTNWLSELNQGIMHIPAGLAYGALTSLNPVYGLYTSLFPNIAYILFGTSRHMSVGTFAVMSIMVYSTITNLEGKYMGLEQAQQSFNESAFSSDQADSTPSVDLETLMKVKLKIATALAFWGGIIQVCS